MWWKNKVILVLPLIPLPTMLSWSYVNQLGSMHSWHFKKCDLEEWSLGSDFSRGSTWSKKHILKLRCQRWFWSFHGSFFFSWSYTGEQPLYLRDLWSPWLLPTYYINGMILQVRLIETNFHVSPNISWRKQKVRWTSRTMCVKLLQVATSHETRIASWSMMKWNSTRWGSHDDKYIYIVIYIWKSCVYI